MTDQEKEELPTPKEKKLLDLLDPKSPDFMGSGMNFFDWMLLHDIQRFKTSFGSQGNTEQRRRLEYIIKASVALHEIRKVSIFATGFCEMAIEDIIKGDLSNLKRWADKVPVFDFSDIKEACEVLWAPFLKIIQEAIMTWPEAKEE